MTGRRKGGKEAKSKSERTTQRPVLGELSDEQKALLEKLDVDELVDFRRALEKEIDKRRAKKTWALDHIN